LEPEKYDMVRYIEEICRPVIEDEAQFSIPFRTKVSWRTYDPLQAMAEQYGNACFMQMVIPYLKRAVAYDMWVGPRAFSKEFLRSYLIPYDGLYGHRWHVLFVPFVKAICDSVEGASVMVDYMHPPEQLLEELRNLELRYAKRPEQLGLVTAMYRALADIDVGTYKY